MSQIDTLADDFSALLNQTQTLLDQAQAQGPQQAQALMADIQAKLAHAKEQLQQVQEGMGENARAVRDATEDYVRQQPWTALGLAAAAGFVLGVLLSGR